MYSNSFIFIHTRFITKFSSFVNQSYKSKYIDKNNLIDEAV